MTTLIVNSNRLDLIDEYHAQNKSIIIDSANHELLFNDGTGTYSTKEQSAQDPRVGDLADLTTTEKSSIVGAINEVDSGVSENAGNITSLGGTVSSLGDTVGSLSGDVSGLDTRVTALEQAPVILPSYSYAGTLAGLATTDWAADASAPVADYGYKATLNTIHSQGDTTTYNESGNVYFSPADAVSGKLAPYAELTTVNYSPVTVVGNPTIDSNYVMTQPNASNYIRSTNLIDFSQATSWKITTKCSGYITNSEDHSGSILLDVTSADRSHSLVKVYVKYTNQTNLYVDFYDDTDTLIAQILIWDYYGRQSWFSDQAAMRDIEVGYDGTNYYAKFWTGEIRTVASNTKIGAGYLSFGSSYVSGNTSYWGSGRGVSNLSWFMVSLADTKLTVDDQPVWEYPAETDQRYAFNVWASEAVATGSIDYSISLLPKGA